jgi:hypothetical protein
LLIRLGGLACFEVAVEVIVVGEDAGLVVLL